MIEMGVAIVLGGIFAGVFAFLFNEAIQIILGE